MNRHINRIILIVLDSLGIGSLPDAAAYGDSGSNTLSHIASEVNGLFLPNLELLGIGHLGTFSGIEKVFQPRGAFGRVAEASAGKDTITGHWEMMGLILKNPFPTFPRGFPDDLISAFCKSIGRKILGNRPASGTEIIKELGRRHVITGYPIVYTSADSVFQIAAHEEVVPTEKLYEMCKVARQLLVGPYAVGRVIARPFVGVPGNFRRTSGRKDFSLPPPEPTLLDVLQTACITTIGIGKIGDIFAGRGIDEVVHTTGNVDGIEKTVEAIRHSEKSFIFTNLIDFDMLYGHRNDIKGYADALKEFDQKLPEILAVLSDSDILIMTADHGCDPTTPGTDHSREYVPLLIYGSQTRAGADLGTRRTLADLGQTIAQIFGVSPLRKGDSFAGIIL